MEVPVSGLAENGRWSVGHFQGQCLASRGGGRYPGFSVNRKEDQLWLADKTLECRVFLFRAGKNELSHDMLWGTSVLGLVRNVKTFSKGSTAEYRLCAAVAHDWVASSDGRRPAMDAAFQGQGHRGHSEPGRVGEWSCRHSGMKTVSEQSVVFHDAEAHRTLCCVHKRPVPTSDTV